MNPQRNNKNPELKSLIKEKRVVCAVCSRFFMNYYCYLGHPKIYKKGMHERLSKPKIGNLNPAKRLEARKKISNAAKGGTPWNKGSKWVKDKIHNKIVDRFAESLKTYDMKIITTYYYVPDAIVIDFDKRVVKALS